MLKLNDNYEVALRSIKCDDIRYSPSEISTISTGTSKFCTNLDTFQLFLVSLLNIYLELNFGVLHAVDNTTYAIGSDKN